jgi:ribulose 1,5-bisphosphate carboxylase large subunit-like protein
MPNVSSKDGVKDSAYTHLTKRLRESFYQRYGEMVSLKFFRSPEGTFLRIVFPCDQFGITGNFAQLLASMFALTEEVIPIRVEDVQVPTQSLGIIGPKFGLQGIRRICNVRSGPMLGMLLKLRSSLTINTYRSMCTQALAGGVDYVIDDELVADMPFRQLGFEKRIRAIREVLKEYQKVSGPKGIYIANISGDPKELVKLLRIACEAGLDAVSANPFIVGFPTFKSLARDSPIPVIAVDLGVSALTRSNTGASENAIAKIARLCGADGVTVGALSSDSYFDENELRQTSCSLREHINGIKKSVPVVAGGVNITNLWKNLHIHGSDAMVHAGTGILAYPGGIRAGVTAFKRIISNIPVSLSSREADSKLLELARTDATIKSGLEHWHWRQMADAFQR